MKIYVAHRIGLEFGFDIDDVLIKSACDQRCRTTNLNVNESSLLRYYLALYHVIYGSTPSGSPCTGGVNGFTGPDGTYILDLLVSQVQFQSAQVLFRLSPFSTT